MAEQAQPTPRARPHNLDAEMAVIGAMLIDQDALGAAAETLRAEDFYSSANADVFRTVCELFDERKDIDIVVLTEELKKRELLDKVGGSGYLMALFDAVPTAANVGHYIEIVREKSLRRRLIKAATEIVSRSHDDGVDLEELLDEAEKSVFEVTESHTTSDAVSMRDVLRETFSRIEQMERREGGLTGLSTGFYDLDELTSGLQDSEMIVVAARPSMGKTSLALNICEHVALVESKACLIFSLEMSANQLVQNMLCSYARLDAHRMRRGMLADNEWADLTLAFGALSEAPIFIDDGAGLSLREIRARARRLKAREDIRLIVVDYLQLMESTGRRRDSREQEIAEVSRGMKALARELRVPVIAISQLNRSVEGREGHRPRMSDLRESGSIEQDADVVILLHRPDYYDENDRPGIAELILAKQRNGPTGRVDLVFRRECMRFENLSAEEAP